MGIPQEMEYPQLTRKKLQIRLIHLPRVELLFIHERQEILQISCVASFS